MALEELGAMGHRELPHHHLLHQCPLGFLQAWRRISYDLQGCATVPPTGAKSTSGLKQMLQVG